MDSEQAGESSSSLSHLRQHQELIRHPLPSEPSRRRRITIRSSEPGREDPAADSSMVRWHRRCLVRVD
jgi:hypothetical protein